MKRKSWLLIGISLLTLMLAIVRPQPSTASKNSPIASAEPQGGQPGNPQFKEGELLVKFKQGVSQNSKQAVHTSIGSVVLKEFPSIGWHHVRLPQGMSVAEGINDYKAATNVVAVEPNYRIQLAAIPNDPSYGDQWGLPKIQAPAAWDTTTGSSSVVLAVLDTGVDYNHADLIANMWHNPGEIPGNGIDDDNDGYVDDVYGIDPSNSDSDPIDDAGHGTECAGVLGAVGNNGVGVVGVNWSVKIMALKIFRNDFSNDWASGAIAAFEYVTLMKSRGVNIRATSNSWVYVGGQAVKDAIDEAGDAGIANVFASGNNGYCDPVMCAGSNLDTNPIYPAAYDSTSIIAVGSSNQTDHISHFSNYGLKSVDLGAPGEGILTTNAGGSYGPHSGTSMSTPFVAGAVGLLAAHDSSLSVASIKATLLNTVDVLPDFVGTSVSGGRLNLATALQQSTVCTYSLGTSSQEFSANPGTGRIEVSTYSNCDFTARSNDSFITVTTPVATGYAFVGYSITANNTGSQRTGTITVAGETFTVIQDAAVAPGCAELSPASENFPIEGGSGIVEITASEKCHYEATAVSNDAWISVTSIKDPEVHYEVEPNPGNARTGTILIADRTFTVTQDSSCTFTLAPTSENFEGSGGYGYFHVSGSAPDCTYTAVNNNPSWISIYSGGSGVGNGYVYYYVYQNNSGVDRSGSISVGGSTYTISQGHCLYDISPSSAYIPANGGNFSLAVTTMSDCPWTATTDTEWLHITSPSGTGNATITYTADKNLTAEYRSGLIHVLYNYYYVFQDSHLPGKIAYTSNADGNYEIYVMNNDGTNQTRLTNNTAYDDNAAWSPDGTKIAFESNRDGQLNIFVMNADGSNQAHLTTTNDSDVNPSWSPDGSKIAFQSFRNGTSQIYVMNADGTNQTRVSNNSFYDYFPTFSPDGSQIAFSTSRDGNLQIYIMNADGSDQTAVTTDAATNHRPAWSPDGSRLAYMSDGFDGYFEIGIITLHGEFGVDPYPITHGITGGNSSPHWSSDSSKITFSTGRDGNSEIYSTGAYGDFPTRLTNTSANESNPAWQPVPPKIAFTSNRDGNHEIYLMNPNGTNPINLTNNAATDSNPSWSPDGMKVAFASNRTGSLSQDIYVVNSDGSNPVNLTNSGDSDVNPAWSPNGTKIAFQSFRNGNSQIYVMNADGSNQTRISNNTYYDYLPSWSPDGTKIAFATTRDGHMQIYVMNADGSNQVNISNTAATDHMPAWSPYGNKIVFASDRSGAFQIYVMNVDGTNQTALTTTGGTYPQWSTDALKIFFSNGEIYAINADGRTNPVNLTNNPAYDYAPAWRPQ